MIVFINNQQWSDFLSLIQGIVVQLGRIADQLEQGFALTTIQSHTGEIMAQTTYTNTTAADTLTFTCTDQNGNNITSSCTFTATSDNTAVVDPGTVTGDTCPLKLANGTANLTVHTVSTTNDTIADVVLACTITIPTPPVTATTTVASATGTVS